MHIFGMITTSGSRSYTEHALSSFFQNTKLAPDDRFILLDNDGNWSGASNYPQIEIVKNSIPQGFAANSNLFVKLALEQKADLVLLNNDLILSPDWFAPLSASKGVISSPISNRELQYTTNVFNSTMIMELGAYLGNEAGFLALVAAHKKNNVGEYRVLALPFFCVRIPYEVIAAVGRFDESFGKGGAEDYDYCLRAILAGFGVQYCLSSYVLHFGGKSSWSGVETREQQDERELKFRSVFGHKWGEDLLKVLLFEDRELLSERTALGVEVSKGNHRAAVEGLLAGRSIAVWL